MRFSATRSDSFRDLVAATGDDLVAVKLPLVGRFDHSLDGGSNDGEGGEFVVDMKADSDPDVEGGIDEREE